MCKEIERSVRLIRRYLPAVCAAAMDAGAVEAVIKSISAIVEQQCRRQLELAPQIRGMVAVV